MQFIAAMSKLSLKFSVSHDAVELVFTSWVMMFWFMSRCHNKDILMSYLHSKCHYWAKDT